MKRHSIIFHSFPSWDAPYIKSTIELAKELSQNNEVYFIDYAYTIKDLFLKNYIPWRSILGKNRGLRVKKLENGAEIKIFSLLPLLPSLNAFNFLNRWIMKRSFQRINIKNINDSVYVNCLNPKWGRLFLKHFEVKQSIYYCYDDLQSMEWAAKKTADYEEQLTNQVDKVICSSRGLKAKFRKIGVKSKILNNGYNSDNLSFDLSSENDNSVHYLGAIDSRIDYSLLEELLKDNPELKFEFTGPVKSPVFSELKNKYLNLHSNGSLNQKDAFQTVAKAGICIIPFVKNRFTSGIYPLKLNEYLALGKAVISTSFSEDIKDFEDLISIADNSIDFNNAIQTGLGSNTNHAIIHRKSFAANNSWRNKAIEFEAMIKDNQLS